MADDEQPDDCECSCNCERERARDSTATSARGESCDKRPNDADAACRGPPACDEDEKCARPRDANERSGGGREVKSAAWRCGIEVEAGSYASGTRTAHGEKLGSLTRVYFTAGRLANARSSWRAITISPRSRAARSVYALKR